jgi:GTPase SAR1 family protein
MYCKDCPGFLCDSCLSNKQHRLKDDGSTVHQVVSMQQAVTAGEPIDSDGGVASSRSQDCAFASHGEQKPSGWKVAQEFLNVLWAGASDVKPGGTLNMSILLIGETGAGKTAFLNFLANLMHGNVPEKYQTYHVHDNEATSRSMVLYSAQPSKSSEESVDALDMDRQGTSNEESQTQKAKSYTFLFNQGADIRKIPGMNPQTAIELTVIDTPGLNDTRGIKQDDANMFSIIQTLDQIDHIHAVVLLTNGSSSRADVVRRYVMNTLLTIFPKQIKENIIVVATNCTSATKNLDTRFFDGQGARPKLVVKLQNPFAVWQKLKIDLDETKKKKGDKAYRKELDRFTGEQSELAYYHRSAVDEIGHLLETLFKLTPIKTRQFWIQYQAKQDLESEIVTHAKLHMHLKQEQDKVQRVLQLIDDHKTSRISFAGYKRQVTVSRTVATGRIGGDRFATICGDGCVKNCHVPCNLSRIHEHGSEAF